MARYWIILLGLLGAVLAAEPISAGSAPGPSFDCTRAKTRIERAICTDPALAREDRDMAALFAATATSAWGKGPSNQRAVQRDWLAGRDTCAGPEQAAKGSSDLNGCLLMAYRQRNGDLAVAALFTERGLALTVLRRVKPGMAGLYEAVALYTDAGPGRNARLDALLLPYWQKLQSGDWSYGQSIVADQITSPGEITLSDKNFGLFGYVVSAYLGDDEEVISHPFPCAALVRRPGLVSAVTPRFGSTFDSFTFVADCSETLPPQPRLKALLQRADSFDPDCEQGSIRFALYRNFALQTASASLGLDPGPGRVQPIPRKIGAGIANAAIAELADQYWRYGGMDKALADRRARAWVSLLANYRTTCGE